MSAPTRTTNEAICRVLRMLLQRFGCEPATKTIMTPASVRVEVH